MLLCSVLSSYGLDFFNDCLFFPFVHSRPYLYFANVGVVPQCAAHLEGATQIDLEGIFHSINVPDRWYGSDNVIDLWHSDMLKLIASSNIYRPSKAATRSRNE